MNIRFYCKKIGLWIKNNKLIKICQTKVAMEDKIQNKSNRSKRIYNNKVKIMF